VPIDVHLLTLFALTTIVAMVVPGPDMLFILGCGMLAGRIGRWLRRRSTARRRLDVAVGGVFIGLGVRLAVE
jgi:threonine/homoserine/homoserine lactone efflux protein